VDLCSKGKGEKRQRDEVEAETAPKIKKPKQEIEISEEAEKAKPKMPGNAYIAFNNDPAVMAEAEKELDNNPEFKELKRRTLLPKPEKKKKGAKKEAAEAEEPKPKPKDGYMARASALKAVMGALWRKAKAEGKNAPYEEKHKEAMKKFKADMAAWRIKFKIEAPAKKPKSPAAAPMEVIFVCVPGKH